MNIIAVDDEQDALEQLERAIGRAAEGAQIHSFASSVDALAYAKENAVDVAFLDIEIREIDGISLAKNLKAIYPRINIIFVTGYLRYMKTAFDIHVSGYVMKPINPERVAEELNNLRSPVKKDELRVYVKCFGNFCVYIDEEPLLFSREKPKELLAYLVHKRGTPVSNAEIAATLWEDQPYTLSVQSNTRNVISRLMKILKAAGIAHILCKGWNTLAIDTRMIACDYYFYLESPDKSRFVYTGQYMSEYSWAESVVSLLNQSMDTQ